MFGLSHSFANWLSHNTVTIIAWCGGLCTFAIYSVLYAENKVYRFFEHVFIGLGAGYGVYVTWSEVLAPKWWTPMVHEGKWTWVFAAVAGAMFLFVYSRKYVWISRIIFGVFMGLAAGSIFRDFYETYFPQIGASMRPVAIPGIHGWNLFWYVMGTVVFYVVLLTSMAYFFFSFEHKNPVLRHSSAVGRWVLMIAFGSIFGATVMGRMTLFIGRFNFLVRDWAPAIGKTWSSSIPGMMFVLLVVIAIIYWIWRAVTKLNQSSGDES